MRKVRAARQESLTSAAASIQLHFFARFYLESRAGGQSKKVVMVARETGLEHSSTAK